MYHGNYYAQLYKSYSSFKYTTKFPVLWEPNSSLMKQKPFTHLLLHANPQHNLLHNDGILRVLPS